MSNAEPLLVQAVYSFKGKNNDELCFKKGDIIVVTQKEEGGWWEGTFNEKTGWFPSNYVQEYKPSTDPLSSPVKFSSPVRVPPEVALNQKANRALVIKDIVDSEKAYVNELQTLTQNFLGPIEKSEALTPEQFRQLTSNLSDILVLHKNLIEALDASAEEQRIGRVFLQYAPEIKQMHYAYAHAHPRAACILEKFKDELTKIMEASGASSPGLLVLTTGLSKPLRRVDKYSGLLHELERHVDEAHPDRGDAQRCVSVYRDIATACAMVRRQKELELEVLNGGVRGWEGEELSHLGEVIHMGSVAVGPGHQDRYLVLFPSTLLVLSVSSRMSAFIYEGKLPLTGIVVSRLEDCDAYKNAFEITGPLIETILAICQTKDDLNLWIEKLQAQIRHGRAPGSVTSTGSQHMKPTPPPHHTALNRPPSNGLIHSLWSLSNLRPAPPLHPAFCRNEKLKPYKGNERSYDEDAQILKVIEAYCSSSSRSRHTLTSEVLDSPTSPCSEKYIVPESVVVQDIRKLQEDMATVQNRLLALTGDIDCEKKARLLLQEVLSQHIETLKLPDNLS